jgi:hypothetical protein
MERVGLLNIYAGWVYIVLGILSGVVLSWWSFGGPMKPPKGYEDYTALPRRLTRLAHIAAFMLPVVDILYGQYIDDVPLSLWLKKTGSIGMVFCMAGLPITLFLGSIRTPLKNLAALPVTGGVIALSIISFGNAIQLVRLLTQ